MKTASEVRNVLGGLARHGSIEQAQAVFLREIVVQLVLIVQLLSELGQKKQ